MSLTVHRHDSLLQLRHLLYSDKGRSVAEWASLFSYARGPMTEGCEGFLNDFSLVNGKSLPDACAISDWVEDVTQQSNIQLM